KAARRSLGEGGPMTLIMKSRIDTRFERGQPPGHYVYILQSINRPDQFYTGLCSDVSQRLAAHNAGQSPHTSKFKPSLLTELRLASQPKATAGKEKGRCLWQRAFGYSACSSGVEPADPAFITGND